MTSIIETGAATTLATIGTSLLKLAWPAVPSWALVACALVVGIGAMELVSLAGSVEQTTAVLATNVIQGVIAAAAGAGIDRTGVTAQTKRDEAQAAQGPPTL
jgi:hypothetical protein